MKFVKLSFLTAVLSILVSCADVSAPLVLQPVEYMPSDIFQETLPSLSFTLPYYPQESMHPTLVENRTNGDLSPLLYEGLFVLDESFQPQPLLVESYQQSEDGYRWTFTLKEGICFWDGTELTGQRVVSAWNEAKGTNSRYGARFGDISSYSASGLVITVQLSSPNHNLPALLDIPISSGGGNVPMGTGAYLYEEGATSLTRNPLWWGEADLPLRIALLPMEGKSELISAFDAGQISLLRGDLTGEQRLGYSGNYQVWEYPSTDFFYLGFHSGKMNASLRTAISYGLDRETFIDHDLAGYGTGCLYPIHPDSQTGQWLGDFAYESLNSIEASTALSRYNGARYGLLVNGDNSQKVSMAEEIAQQLGEYGLNIWVNALPWGDYLDALSAGNFDMYLGEIYLTADFNLGDLFLEGGAYNYGNYENASLSTLWWDYQRYGLDAVGEEGTFFYYSFLEEMPFAPLCFKTGTALSLWGHLASASPVHGNLFYQVEDWDFASN